MTILPRRLVAPSALPVDVSDVKLNLNITTSSQDAVLTALIDAVTSILDGFGGYLGRGIVKQTWEQGYKSWPSDRGFVLPFPDCDINDICYIDEYGNSQVLDSASISDPLETGNGTYIRISSDANLPALDSIPAPVTVQFTTGWSVSKVPEQIRQAIIIEVCAIYNQMSRDISVKSESVFNVGSRTYENFGINSDTRSLASPASERLLLKYKLIRA